MLYTSRLCVCVVVCRLEKSGYSFVLEFSVNSKSLLNSVVFASNCNTQKLFFICKSKYTSTFLVFCSSVPFSVHRFLLFFDVFDFYFVNKEDNKEKIRIVVVFTYGFFSLSFDPSLLYRKLRPNSKIERKE